MKNIKTLEQQIEKIEDTIETLKNKKIKIQNIITNEIQQNCLHKDKYGKPTIEYDDIYEMKVDEMHCTQCGKSISRKNFQ